MEVWLVNHYAITPDRPGGTRHFDLGTELTKHGFKVKVFACDINLSTRKRTLLKESETFRVEKHGDLEFVWVNATEYEQNNWKRVANMLTFSKNFQRAAMEIMGDTPVAIVGSSPHPFAAIAAMKLSKRLGSTFFLELRDLWPQALVDMGEVAEGHPMVRVMRNLERRLYKGAKKVIILAEGSAGYLTKRGIKPEDILYIPNGVHLEHFKPSRSRVESRAKYRFERFTFVYTGAHGPANALGTILEAARELESNKNIEFALFGDGPSKAALKEAGAGLTNLRFFDPVPKGEIPNILAAADGGIITLKDVDAFAYAVSPNKLFDYMGASLPVICATPGDMARMVETSECGFTSKPEDSADLATKTLEMSRKSAEELAAFGERGLAYVSANFSRQALAAKLAESLRGAG
ncbi:MAG: glycosyltransferase family 4 protein [Fimbriimonadaceae bacterium]